MPAPNQSDKSKVYSEQEQLLILAHLARKAEEHPDNTDFYAIMVLFQLGIRIGVLIALCWSDIDWESDEIHVYKMENISGDTGNTNREIVSYGKKKSIYADR